MQSNHPPKAGQEVEVAGAFSVRLVERAGPGVWRVEAQGPESWLERCERWGRVPLPPYIERPDDPSSEDERRYQTVFARAPGAVAAPTAGLHFDAELIEAIHRCGAEICFVTLHVGWGTFRPVTQGMLEEGRLHPERYSVERQAWETIRFAKREGRRIVAVGTTTCRVLETLARREGVSGETDLLIAPGFEFRAVDALFTNFHLPKSSLLLLVCAFAGRDRALAAYREAVESGYRFYSYGDAMLIE